MPNPADSDVNLCCPICLEKHSVFLVLLEGSNDQGSISAKVNIERLDNTDDRIPIVARRCAHTICQPCATKRNSPICVVCGVTSVNSNGDELRSTKWHKNFTLIECLEAMKQLEAECDRKLIDLKSEYENDIDHMPCGQCGVREKRGRMKICCSCAGIKEMDGTGKDVETEVLSVTICAFCYTEYHMGHSVINYLTFKVHNLLSLTSSDGIEMVSSMDEMCVQEAQNGAEQIMAWKEKMKNFSVQHGAYVSYRDCLSINDSLKNEAEIVCNASEDTLPSLRKLTKIVRESNGRVSTLLSRITTKRKNEGMFGYFTKNSGFVKDDGICLYTSKSSAVVCVGRVPDVEAIARVNRIREGFGLVEYLRLQPAVEGNQTRSIQRCLAKRGFATEVNDILRTRCRGDAVTIWKVVYGGEIERQGEEEREQTEESDSDEEEDDEEVKRQDEEESAE